MASTMAATRQPFGPVDSSRLQSLTSLKNRQNALSTPPTAIKRKAASFDNDFDDAENVDPVIFLSPKRSKAVDGSSKDSGIAKPVNYFLTKAPQPAFESLSPPKASTAPRRPMLQARSPLPKLSTASVSKSSPLTAPAGRSPTRKRVGILNRRRTASPFTRVEPPKFGGTSSGLGFSIDAALSGTIPSYAARQRREQKLSTRNEVRVSQSSSKASWFFDIHEDTADELATNLMEHSTCTLDISSDEESAARMRDERGKENVPPPDDVSQTRTLISEPEAPAPSADLKARSRASRRRQLDDNAIDVDRSPLGDLPAEDFYAEGCDEKSVFIVDEEEEYATEHEHEHDPEQVSPSVLAAAGLNHPTTFDFSVKQPQAEEDVKVVSGAVSDDVVDELMRKSDWVVAPKAAVLEPIEKAEEGFQVWESGSAKGDE